MAEKLLVLSVEIITPQEEEIPNSAYVDAISEAVNNMPLSAYVRLITVEKEGEV